jgi:ankyrin repeat protein
MLHDDLLVPARPTIRQDDWVAPVQETIVKSKGELIADLAFVFRLRHLYSACVGKASSTLFILSVDAYHHVCSTYVDDAAKVVETTIHAVELSGAQGKSQTSGTSAASTALRASEQAQERVNEAVRRQTEQYALSFIEAAAQNDAKSVTRILDTGKLDVDESDYDGRTALHLAASNGHTDMVQLLLERYGASHTVKDRYNGTPLDDAIREGHLEVVQLLRGIAKKSAPSRDKIQAFIQAAADNNLKVVEIFHASELDPNCCDDDHRTALHLSVSNRSHDVLRFLINLPNIKLGPVDGMGHTPLWDAVMDGNVEIARMLRCKGAPVQPDLANDLCQAAAENNAKFFERLSVIDIDVLPRVRIHFAQNATLLLGPPNLSALLVPGLFLISYHIPFNSFFTIRA